MPRKARKQSTSGVYHMIMRGINRQAIFIEDEDCHRFLQTLKYYKEKSGYQIFAYCLMGNHIHLLMKIGAEPLAQIMRRICGKYVYWYNEKYDRIGNLFQDRFKSEPVEDNLYFITVLRYIHQNPLKVGLVKEIDQYPWSSFNAYLKQDDFIDKDFVLSMFDNINKKALAGFIEFNKQTNDQRCMDIDDNRRISNLEAVNLIKLVCKINSLDEIQIINRKTMNSYLRELKKGGLSIRMIEKLTGINRGVVLKA